MGRCAADYRLSQPTPRCQPQRGRALTLMRQLPMGIADPTPVQIHSRGSQFP
jgi:hypothetical protein